MQINEHQFEANKSKLPVIVSTISGINMRVKGETNKRFSLFREILSDSQTSIE